MFILQQENPRLGESKQWVKVIKLVIFRTKVESSSLWTGDHSDFCLLFERECNLPSSVKSLGWVTILRLLNPSFRN